MVKVRFQTREFVDPTLMRNTLAGYDWAAKGLQLMGMQIEAKGGTIILRLLPSFILPIAWVAIATIVPSVIGLVGTVVKMWVVAQIANPLLAPGPLGFPMVFWLIIAAGGVLIPTVILIRRRK